MASGYSPAPQTEFSGLNLRDAPDSVGNGCIDCLNIDLDYSGTRVRSRDGSAKLNSSTVTDQLGFLHRQDSTRLLAGTTGPSGNLYSVSTSGTMTSLATSIFPSGAANFGTPTSTATYVGTDGTATLKKVVGTTYSSPTATVDGATGKAMPKAAAVAVQDTDNRLVVSTAVGSTGPDGASSSVHHVWFSDAGNAESWSSNNYVQLTPGDGEQITQIVSWRGQLFVFKQTRLFIFYGNSTDASGNPIFNYRTVQLPSRVLLRYPPQSAVAVGEDGIYYVAQDGVYVTTGDPPTLLSGDLYPLATGISTPFFTATTGAKWGDDLSAIFYFKRRLYVSLGYASTPVLFVYDVDTANWMAWGGITPFSFTAWEGEVTSGRLYFGTADGYIKRFSPSFTDDDGTSISSYYRSGFNDFGREEEKTIAETQLWGTGNVDFAWSRDFGSLDTASTVTLGTSPAIANGRSLMDKTGTLMSYKLSGTSPWAVHRVTPYLREEESPGSKRS